MELNASDERCIVRTVVSCFVLRFHRGIDVVRNKIKAFAQKKVTLPAGRHKIVILYEADRCASRSAPVIALTYSVV